MPTDRVDDLGLVPGALPPSLVAAVQEFAARPQVLVALDFDGVLAPIVADPEAARPLPQAAQALTRLVGCPGVRLALVSGRTLADLRRLADPPPAAWLVGSHGAQFAWPAGDPVPEGGAQGDVPEGAGGHGGSGPRVETPGVVDPGAVDPGVVDPEAVVPGLDEAARDLLARVTTALERISDGHPGTLVERKPAGAVLHTRQAPRSAARRATEAALSGPSTWPGVYLTRGKEVVDLSVVDASKGVALTALRARAGLAPRGGGVLYVGDDVTDERAFAVLDDDRGDVSVKVGEGTSIAQHRVDGPRAVVALLDLLADLRGH